MNAFWFGVVFVGPWLLFGYALWRIYFRNKFQVEPNNRERVVIQNAVMGTMDVLGPGTHFRGPWWKLFKRVPVNREPVEITSEECKSKDGVRLTIDYRYDMLSGRPFDQNPASANFGKLLDKKCTDIDHEVVKLAVTAIDFDERKDRIQQVVMAAVEAAIGAKLADDLLVPTVGTAALYDELNMTVQERSDRDLTFVGINILDFRVTNLRALDDKLQEAYENKKRLAKLRESAAEVRGDPADPASRITYREALAAGTDQFGTVVLGQAAGDAARAIGRGLSDIGKGLAKK